MKLIPITIFLLFNWQSGYAQTPAAARKAKLKELSFLIGQWSVWGEEKNSVGDSFTQQGSSTWTWDMDSTTIRRDLVLHVIQSTGDYDALARDRKFTEFIVFNTSRNMYEVIDFDSGFVGTPRTFLFDPRTRTIRNFSSFFNSKRTTTLQSTLTMTLKSKSEIEITQLISAVDSDFKEEYRSVLKKR